ncbi:2-oxoacid:acceptor oxidoreductase family protein [Candidatus Bathyarchaeota archaeon]|nr:2-oxoacid:acceptor oxidoreductase family protein [Candidatus Bathyarchaeota archaeon]
MWEIFWLGRAGQGVITAGHILSAAAIKEGKHVQAFPQFGAERLGAPVRGYTRISDEPIEIHSSISKPDAAVIMDVNLLRDLVKSGSLPEAKLLVVNNGGDKQLAKQIGSQRSNVWTVNATGISMNIFGRVIVNTPMVGALIKVMPIVSLKSVEEAIMERFKGALGERNVEAVRKAYESVEEVKP